MTAAICTPGLAWTAIGQTDWYEPFPAHKVVANVYFVGSKTWPAT